MSVNNKRIRTVNMAGYNNAVLISKFGNVIGKRFFPLCFCLLFSGGYAQAATLVYVSHDASRSDSMVLGSEKQSGKIFVFAETDRSPNQVRFFVDDPAMILEPINKDRRAPYDLMGSTRSGLALPFDTVSITDGEHQLTVELKYKKGASDILHIPFVIENNPVVTKTDVTDTSGGEVIDPVPVADATNDTTCTNCQTDYVLTLDWTDNPEIVDGYRVFYGNEADSAVTLLTETTVSEAQILAYSDLGLLAGDQVCFRLKAWLMSEESAYSSSICTVL